jgi:hypothetical protein
LLFAIFALLLTLASTCNDVIQIVGRQPFDIVLCTTGLHMFSPPMPHSYIHLSGVELLFGMVHTGFSRGCDRCRDKHLRCDQTMPNCVRCTSQGLPCPGYRDQGGFLFKNESEKVIRNGKQRHARRATSGSCTLSKIGSPIDAVSRSASKSPSSTVPCLHPPLFLRDL